MMKQAINKSICSVPNCKFQSDVKFHSPRNESQLGLWKRILNIGEDKFMVCDHHFEDRHIRIRKLGITTDAYPSMFLGNVDEDSTDHCQCCLKSFLTAYCKKQEDFYKITDELKAVFRDVMECELPSGIICGKCHTSVTNFSSFRANIRKNLQIKENIARAKASAASKEEQSLPSTATVKEEPADDDDEVEIMETELERISVADDDGIADLRSFEDDEGSVIRFVDHPTSQELCEVEIKQERLEDESSQDSSEHMPVQRSTRTYANRAKAAAVPEDPIGVRVKEEPIDDSYDFHLPASSLFVDLKTEPADESAITLAAEPSTSSKRSLADADIPVAPKSRRIVQGSSPYTSSLPPRQQGRRPVVSQTAKLVAAIMSNLKCQYCVERFSNRSQLQVHIQASHNFKCTQCTASFPYSITLIQHQMSEHAEQASEQTGRFPVAYKHSCPVCKLKFASVESLSTHMKQKHNMDTNGKEIEERLTLSQKIIQKFTPARPRSALITVKKEVDIETLSEVHNNLNGIPCADCGLLYKPNKLERHRMEKHNKH